MNSPSPNYLDLINSTLTGGPAPGNGPVMLGNGPAPAPPLGLPGAPAPIAPPPSPPTPPPGPMMSPKPPPPVLANSAASPAPMPPPGPPQGAAQGPSPGFLQHISSAGAANVAAKETELRGPQLLNAQQQRNDAFQGAIAAVSERAEHTQAADMALALDQQRKAGIREDAANYSAAERSEEMQQRQQDFDLSVKALSQQSVDPDRFWANAGVGRKIAVLLSAGLAGMVQGRHGGGSNIGIDVAMKLADQDIKAQEFAYNSARDTVNAKQNAFGMAMQKYQNVDQARAAARAAAMDTIGGQLAQSAALWKGTEAANHATEAMALLQNERMQQIQQGVAFAPARQVAVAGKWRDPRTGLEYTDNEAKGIVKTMDENEFKHGEKVADVAGNLMVEREKAGAKAGEKADEGAKFVSSQLQQAGIPQARAAAERALKALNATEGGAGEGAVRGVLGKGLGNKVMSHEANEREQAYADFKNTAIKATMGNATESEVGRAEEGLGSINDPAARRRAIMEKIHEYDEIEKNARAGASGSAQKEFSSRRANAEGGPPVAPKGAAQGWK